MIVAVDGPAGSGKSTVARKAADAVGFGYLDSGMLYRGVSKAIFASGEDHEDQDKAIEIASTCRFRMEADTLLMNDQALEGIYTDLIDRWSSTHSKIVEIRKMVNAQLRSIVGNRDFIVMGRDIGTVVFPDAQLKVFLDASVEVRAARRHLQGGKKLDRDYIQREIEQRDSTDRQKAFGKLELAPGAVYIDTSDLTIDQVCDRVVREILKNTNIRQINRESEYGQ